jgi:hypothetical protein
VCSGLAELRQQNRLTQGFKYTKESAANVISAIRQWVFFSVYFLLPIVPASVDSVICFLEFMSKTSSFGHLKHLLSSLKFLHLSLGYSFPAQDFKIDMTMQGLKRKLAQVPFQVLPITPRVLRDMYKHLDMSKPGDLALWSSFLVSFYGLLRKSNAVPKNIKYDPSKVLTRRNILVDPHTNMVYIYVGFSKTNQFGSRDLIIPVPGNSDPALDPVRHLDALFTRFAAHPEAAAFSYGPSSFINYSSFTTRLKNLLTKSGYNAKLYSGHSFRRGGASFLHACGGTALMVQASGDWSSQCFTRYLYLSLAERLKSQSIISWGISTGQ